MLWTCFFKLMSLICNFVCIEENKRFWELSVWQKWTFLLNPICCQLIIQSRNVVIILFVSYCKTLPVYWIGFFLSSLFLYFLVNSSNHICWWNVIMSLRIMLFYSVTFLFGSVIRHIIRNDWYKALYELLEKF